MLRFCFAKKDETLRAAAERLSKSLIRNTLVHEAQRRRAHDCKSAQARIRVARRSAAHESATDGARTIRRGYCRDRVPIGTSQAD